jgi:hypothetical protein
MLHAECRMQPRGAKKNQKKRRTYLPAFFEVVLRLLRPGFRKYFKICFLKSQVFENIFMVFLGSSCRKKTAKNAVKKVDGKDDRKQVFFFLCTTSLASPRTPLMGGISSGGCQVPRTLCLSPLAAMGLDLVLSSAGGIGRLVALQVQQALLSEKVLWPALLSAEMRLLGGELELKG